MKNQTIPHRLYHFQMRKYIRSLGCQKKCTAVNKEKGICFAQEIEQQIYDEEPTNAEIAGFFRRNLL